MCETPAARLPDAPPAKGADRLCGPDIIRCLAALFVPMTHAFTYLGTLSADVGSLRWTVYVMLHYIALSCVPLFMLLSGFFLREKKISGRYYAGLCRILIPYLLISVITVLTVSAAKDPGLTLRKAVFSILNFTANDYAWYVEMYIGLYLLIPFLNLLWQAAAAKRRRLLLISLLALLTLLPSFIKSFGGTTVSLDFIPDWWENLYPVTYYFIGAWIAEYRPRLRKRVSLPLFLLAVAVPTAANCLYSAGGEYAWFMMNRFCCLSTACIAVTLFLVLYDIPALPRPLWAAVRALSLCSFELYLFSFIADQGLYRYKELIFPWLRRLHIPRYAGMVALVFALSWLAARLLRFGSVPLTRLAERALSKERREKAA